MVFPDDGRFKITAVIERLLEFKDLVAGVEISRSDGHQTVQQMLLENVAVDADIAKTIARSADHCQLDVGAVILRVDQQLMSGEFGIKVTTFQSKCLYGIFCLCVVAVIEDLSFGNGQLVEQLFEVIIPGCILLEIDIDLFDTYRLAGGDVESDAPALLAMLKLSGFDGCVVVTQRLQRLGNLSGGVLPGSLQTPLRRLAVALSEGEMLANVLLEWLIHTIDRDLVITDSNFADDGEREDDKESSKPLFY